jgi:hypothetical protein
MKDKVQPLKAFKHLLDPDAANTPAPASVAADDEDGSDEPF